MFIYLSVLLDYAPLPGDRGGVHDNQFCLFISLRPNIDLGM